MSDKSITDRTEATERAITMAKLLGRNLAVVEVDARTRDAAGYERDAALVGLVLPGTNAIAPVALPCRILDLAYAIGWLGERADHEASVAAWYLDPPARQTEATSGVVRTARAVDVDATEAVERVA